MKTFTLATALLAAISFSNTSCVAEQQQIVPTREDQRQMNEIYQELFGVSWSVGPFEIGSRLVGDSLTSAFADCKGRNYFWANQNCVYTPGVWDSFSYSPQQQASVDELYVHVTFANHTLQQSIDYIDKYVGKKYQFKMVDIATLFSFYRVFPERFTARSRRGWLFCAADENSRKNGNIPCIENRNDTAVLTTVSLRTVPKAGSVLEGNTVALPTQLHKPVMFLTRRVERNPAATQ